MATIGPTVRGAGVVVVRARVVGGAGRVVVGVEVLVVGRVVEVVGAVDGAAAVAGRVVATVRGSPPDEHAASVSRSALAAANDLPQHLRLLTPP